MNESETEVKVNESLSCLSQNLVFIRQTVRRFTVQNYMWYNLPVARCVMLLTSEILVRKSLLCMLHFLFNLKTVFVLIFDNSFDLFLKYLGASCATVC